MEVVGVPGPREHLVEARVEEAEGATDPLVGRRSNAGPDRGPDARPDEPDVVPADVDDHRARRPADDRDVGDSSAAAGDRPRSDLPVWAREHREPPSGTPLVAAPRRRTGGVAGPAGLREVRPTTADQEVGRPHAGDVRARRRVVDRDPLRARGRPAVAAGGERAHPLGGRELQDGAEDRHRPVARGVARDRRARRRTAVDDPDLGLAPTHGEDVRCAVSHHPVDGEVETGARVRREDHLDGGARGGGTGPLDVQDILVHPGGVHAARVEVGDRRDRIQERQVRGWESRVRGEVLEVDRERGLRIDDEYASKTAIRSPLPFVPFASRPA